MAENPIDKLDTFRFKNSNAGKLIKRLIKKGLMSVEDLGNPDVITLINDCEEITPDYAMVEDSIYYIEENNPKETFLRGIVNYKGFMHVWGYGNRGLVLAEGITISTVNCFPSNRFEKYTQLVFPRVLPITTLDSEQHLFRLTPEALARVKIPTVDWNNLVAEA